MLPALARPAESKRIQKGKRHAYGKRHIYLDEDSWCAVMSDSYDGRGTLWRHQWGATKCVYDEPATTTRAFVLYDLTREDYANNGLMNGQKVAHRHDKSKPGEQNE